MVRLQELSVAPEAEKKKFIYQSGKQNIPKKEWHLEKERRKQRAQKKEQRRKQMEEQKESEKNKWKNFNTKANTKNMKVCFLIYCTVFIRPFIFKKMFLRLFSGIKTHLCKWISTRWPWNRYWITKSWRS